MISHSKVRWVNHLVNPCFVKPKKGVGYCGHVMASFVRRGSKPTLLRSGRLNGKLQKEEGDEKKDDWEDEERIEPLASFGFIEGFLYQYLSDLDMTY